MKMKFAVLLFFVLLLEICSTAHAVSYTKISTGGTASASSTYNSSYPAAKAFDGNTSTGWMSSNSSPPVWLKYTLPASRAVSKYQIYSGKYNSPRAWKFQGWNGSSWVTLDSRSGYSSWTSGTAKTFTISNSTQYKNYRLYVTANNPLVIPNYYYYYYTVVTELVLFTHSVPIANFSASTSLINIGGSSKLGWTSTYATSASINQGIGTVSVNGSCNVSPRVNTMYTLTTQGVGGNTTKTVTINIFPPTAEGFEANDSIDTVIVSGDPLTFDWAVTNVTSVSIDNGVGSVYSNSNGIASTSGSKVIYPSTTSKTTKTYTLTAKGPAGTETKSVSVTIYSDVTDSDGDGLPDWYEVYNYEDLTTQGISSDTCDCE